MKKIFECQRCGFCCQGESTVSLSEKEISRLASFLGVSQEDFLENYAVVKGPRVEMRTVNGHCLFYDEEKGLCRIHPVKPDRCREWPLHPSILKDPENFTIIKSTCPGFRKDITWEEWKEFLENEFHN